jgi:hypothetical protein
VLTPLPHPAERAASPASPRASAPTRTIEPFDAAIARAGVPPGLRSRTRARRIPRCAPAICGAVARLLRARDAPPASRGRRVRPARRCEPSVAWGACAKATASEISLHGSRLHLYRIATVVADERPQLIHSYRRSVGGAAMWAPNLSAGLRRLKELRENRDTIKTWPWASWCRATGLRVSLFRSRLKWP